MKTTGTYATAETSVACLTPAGSGAIATIGLRGPNAWPIVRSLLHSPLPPNPRSGHFYLGWLGADSSTCDEVVITFKENSCELHSHGGIEVVRLILELCAARGARVRDWAKFDGEGVSNIRALARMQLIHAPTLRTASILLDQMQGAFSRTIDDICQRLAHGYRTEAAALLGRLVQTQHLGRHLVEPFRVVIAGAPNVGKSSFVNALAGYTRSLVSPLPGTTRDVVTTSIALDGWPVELTDTAGMRGSADSLEREGIERARRILARADIRLWMCEASSNASSAPLAGEWKFDGTILNKVDLLSELDRDKSLLGTGVTYAVSCLTGEGIQDACRMIVALLDRGVTPRPREGVAFTPELCDRVIAAHAALKGGDVAAALAQLRGFVS